MTLHLSTSSVPQSTSIPGERFMLTQYDHTQQQLSAATRSASTKAGAGFGSRNNAPGMQNRIRSRDCDWRAPLAAPGVARIFYILCVSRIFALGAGNVA